MFLLRAGVIEALAPGVAGCLVFGVGMCVGLDVLPGGMVIAVLIGIAGAAIMLMAYPVYKKIFGAAKRKMQKGFCSLQKNFKTVQSK